MTPRTPERDAHAARVDAWLGSVAAEAPAAARVALFERALGALWRRARIPLGVLTLTVVVRRVLHVSVDAFPWLAAVKLDAEGVQLEGLRALAGERPGDELEAGLRFVLVELLTVLGVLSGEILTPALHDELSRVARVDDARAAPASRGEAPAAGRDPREEPER